MMIYTQLELFSNKSSVYYLNTVTRKLELDKIIHSKSTLRLSTTPFLSKMKS
jgi:hypothetical protein